MTEGAIAPFRIAIRQEGEWIHAYLAPMGNMDPDNLVLLATVRLHFLEAREPLLFNTWKGFLQQGVAALIKMTAGVDVKEFRMDPAPEHERSGTPQ